MTEEDGTGSVGKDFVDGVGDSACTPGLDVSPPFSPLRLLSEFGESSSLDPFSFTPFPFNIPFILSASSSKST